jgi:hypothetical protein
MADNADEIVVDMDDPRRLRSGLALPMERQPTAATGTGKH